MGRSVARELARKPVPFVVVDTSEEKLRKYSSEGWLTLAGDATLAKVLQHANIDKARGLVAATTTDAINIYIILTARSLNPAEDHCSGREEDAEKHLLTAGADSVVSPYNFAGYRIAQSFLRPNVVDFFDTAMNRQQHLEIEEINVGERGRVAGQTLEGSRIRQEMGVIVLAIKSEKREMRFNPAPDEVIDAGDHLIAMGEPEGLRRLEESSAGPHENHDSGRDARDRSRHHREVRRAFADADGKRRGAVAEFILERYPQAERSPCCAARATTAAMDS